jgi:hypothetical protein
MKITSAMALAVVGVMISAGTSSATTNLIVNGGFETGDFTGWTVAGDATGVATTGFDGFAPHSGTYFAALGDTSESYPYGTLSQTVTDASGQALTLSYWLASDGAQPNYFDATWDGTLISGSQITNSNAFGYIDYQFTVVGTGTDTLLFHEQNVPAYDALDDVSLTAAVPEPTTWAMMLLGFMGLGIAGYRNSRNRSAALAAA